ncbi:hypothetical protein BsWGS_05110 [Bradybaena similaris]
MVLSANDAAYLITKRECLGKLILSVTGAVTALSDVTRAGKNQMALVEVDKCIILVIKDFHLEWHSVLEVGHMFVFKNLRLTTLEKGISKPCSVLLVLETSLLSCLKDADVITPISLQEWLKMNSVCDVLLNPEASRGADGEEIQELVNYEGTVTSIDMAAIGIFVLDGKLRLVAASDSVSSIKKDSRVSVYNAHIIRDGSQAYLVCCMRSRIRIHEPVSSVENCAVSSSSGIEACVSTTAEDSVNNKLRVFVQNCIRKYGLNLKEILALQQLYSVLFRQTRSRYCQEKLFSHFVKSDLCANLTRSHVQATDLFIFHEQLCPFNQCKSQESRIPQTVGLNALKEEVINVKSASVLTWSGIQAQSSPHHLQVCYSSGKILVGCIMTCSEGTVFWDGATKLRAIILSDSDTVHTDQHNDVNTREHPLGCCKDTTDCHSQPHVCCQCCCSPCKPGTRLTCPVLDPWLVGATICVTKFHVVLESYPNSRTSDALEADMQNHGHVCMYLAFRLLDCILLDTIESISPVKVGSEIGSVLLPVDLSPVGRLTRKRKCQPESTCYIYVREKQPLTYKGSQFKSEKSCQFDLLGSKIYLDFKMEKNIECEKTCVTRRKSTDSEHFAEKQENFLQGSCEQRQESICASFLNSTAKWYSWLSSGHLYRLSATPSTDDPEPFKSKLLKVLPQDVMKRYNVRMNIEIPEDLFVERLPLTLSDPYWGLGKMDILHPIGQIMSASFSETVVSFKGVIVGRDNEASFKSNMQTRGRMSASMTNTKLEVQDTLPDTKDACVCGKVSIYLDAPKSVYTLGLVPGAIVKFCRVERKVSKAGNIYCRFIAVSIAEVLQFQDLTYSTRSHTNIANLPKELLINLWHFSADSRQTGNQVFTITCHIERIFSLRIKTVCSSCKSLFSKNGCQSRDCGSSAWPEVVASAVLLVGDGTLPATVKIWDSNLICRLLTLTHKQWEDLVTEVTSHSEVVLDSSSPPTSSIAIFLQDLISSSLVLRPCRMAVRIYKSSDLDKFRLEDFQESEVRIGKQVLRTFSLPRMQFNCLAISEIE